MNSKFAQRVFLGAGVYGLIVLLPLYFLEDALGRRFPPPVTHPENYYGFIGVAIAWQFVFLMIARDPQRLRPVMLAAVAEKYLSAFPVVLLGLSSRVPPAAVFFGVIDLALGAGFLVAYIGCGITADQYGGEVP